ncbi:toll/interleukin-1 receptor domain-containing protein [Actinotalea ferrariae]|uniref:toll/interleukin-1 receptor domain-containing protein n=1 Tax=Actinotalea ferrariae TaxID=1386098 RepID=UPI001C8C4C8F|nr:toll/interleukin-1 receptor domain-containing protein [Actinotalea ferrariae]MBX9245825.1 toll/interleukin-1 receptor domain-containing protein [Actinotalea ferrariae]
MPKKRKKRGGKPPARTDQRTTRTTTPQSEPPAAQTSAPAFTEDPPTLRPRTRTFVSHASEDKWFVKNLVDTLIRYGVDAWYDDYEIEVGDSIRGKINEGLLTSDYGIVVLSQHFFAKKWPKQELAALANILSDDRVLPLMHRITPAEVAGWDPLLSDIKALRVRGNIRNVVAPIAKKILGSGEKENGRSVYRSQTISIRDVPMNVRGTIENVTFEDCVVQGIALLNVNSGVGWDDCIFNGPEVFMPAPHFGPFIGLVGLENVTFVRCRFKDIGFLVPPEWIPSLNGMPTLPPGFDIPAHLR